MPGTWSAKTSKAKTQPRCRPTRPTRWRRKRRESDGRRPWTRHVALRQRTHGVRAAALAPSFKPWGSCTKSFERTTKRTAVPIVSDSVVCQEHDVTCTSHDDPSLPSPPAVSQCDEPRQPRRRRRPRAEGAAMRAAQQCSMRTGSHTRACVRTQTRRSSTSKDARASKDRPSSRPTRRQSTQVVAAAATMAVAGRRAKTRRNSHDGSFGRAATRVEREERARRWGDNNFEMRTAC